MKQEQLYPHFNQDFICNNCQRKFYQTTAYSPIKEPVFLNETYCADCIEEEPEFCSFNEIDDKTKKAVACTNEIFDKKKQLCRSHNRQVRKRFNEFLKDESIAGNGAWEMAWEQSGDWKYFWNLTKEKKETISSSDENEPREAFASKKQKSWGVAPVHETTENIQSLNIDKRTLKKTGRVHLFATRVKKEWIEQLKTIAYEERLHYNEVLERALECYEKQRRK